MPYQLDRAIMLPERRDVGDGEEERWRVEGESGTVGMGKMKRFHTQ